MFSLWGGLALTVTVPAGSVLDEVVSVHLSQGRTAYSVSSAEWVEIEAEVQRGGRSGQAIMASPGKAVISNAKPSLTRARRFLVPVPNEVAARFDLAAPIEVSLGAPKTGRPAVLHVHPLGLADLVSGFGSALARMPQSWGRDDLAPILRASISTKPLDIPNRFEIQDLVLSGTGLVGSGWMANLRDRTIHVVSEDLETWLLDPGIQRVSRPEVHAHLRSEDALTSDSDEHGFAFVMPQPAEGQGLYFVEILNGGREAVFHGPLQAEVTRDDALAMNIVRDAFGDIRSLAPEEVDRSYRLLLSTDKGEMRAQVFDFGPKLRQDRPVASVIIPFYGDAFFLNCVHYLQRVLDDSFELVLVVDDPRIWAEIYNGLALRSTGLRVPTRLLRNMANYGYGGANNLGASLSRGDVLFLMNSDILVKDPSGLVKAAEAIRQRKRTGGREVVVGFSLLYEDNTIQHLGMTFPRSSAMGNLLVADHPMKGLPFDLYDGDAIRPAQAVTAALMALSKDLFLELNGFDLRYERGDFEDADLCLRARQLGAEIQVHVHPGLYHLERQSIPSMGDNDIRAMVTYMNCAEFNRRWEAELTRPKRVFKVSAPKASA